MNTATPLPLSLWRCCAILLLGLAASACATEPKPAGAAELLRQIQTEIGGAACSSSQQCHTLAVGAKACGGPEAYLAWSSQRSDGAKLSRLAKLHQAERAAENAGSGRVSNCLFVVDPGAQCLAGRCQLGSGGALLR